MQSSANLCGIRATIAFGEHIASAIKIKQSIIFLRLISLRIAGLKAITGFIIKDSGFRIQDSRWIRVYDFRVLFFFDPNRISIQICGFQFLTPAPQGCCLAHTLNRGPYSLQVCLAANSLLSKPYLFKA